MFEYKKAESSKSSPNQVLGEKLFVPRDLEGQLNKKPLEIARQLNDEFEKEKGYVGLMVFGSSVEGFYSNKDSDLDVYFMYDSSLYDKKNFFGKKVRENFFYKVDCLIKKQIQNIKEEHGKKVQVPNWFRCDINPSKLISNLQSKNIGLESGAVVRLAELMGLAVGNKIENYRKIFSQYLQSLSKDEQLALKERIIKLKVEQAETSHRKRIERNENFSEESKKEFIQKRRELWIKRIEKIYGI
jgi:predicted nucleotidyltransferase